MVCTFLQQGPPGQCREVGCGQGQLCSARPGRGVALQNSPPMLAVAALLRVRLPRQLSDSVIAPGSSTRTRELRKPGKLRGFQEPVCLDPCRASGLIVAPRKAPKVSGSASDSPGAFCIVGAVRVAATPLCAAVGIEMRRAQVASRLLARDFPDHVGRQGGREDQIARDPRFSANRVNGLSMFERAFFRAVLDRPPTPRKSDPIGMTQAWHCVSQRTRRAPDPTRFRCVPSVARYGRSEAREEPQT